MKNYKKLLLLISIVSFVGIVGCGGGDDEMTEQEKVLSAVSGSHQIDVTASSIPTDASVTTAGIFASTDDATGVVTVSTTGDITSWIDGGSFTVGEDGSISGATVTPADGSNLAVSSATAAVDLDASTLTIEIFTAADARMSGIGSWTLVVTL